MKNSEKVATAQKVVDYAKSIGFEDASLTIQDEHEDVYESLADVQSNYSADEDIILSLHVFLTNDLEIKIVAEDEDDEENEETRLEFVD